MANSETPPTSEQIKRIAQRFTELYRLMQSFHNILRQRGFRLPVGLAQSLIDMKEDIDSLAEHINEDHVELLGLRRLVAHVDLLYTAPDRDALLDTALDEIMLLTQAERGFIFLRNNSSPDSQPGDEETRALHAVRLRVVTGELDEPRSLINTFILDEVFSVGRSILADNLYNSQHLGQVHMLRSVICVPLRYDDRHLGAVYVDRRFPHGVFTERDQRLLESLIRHLSLALTRLEDS